MYIIIAYVMFTEKKQALTHKSTLTKNLVIDKHIISQNLFGVALLGGGPTLIILLLW